MMRGRRIILRLTPMLAALALLGALAATASARTVPVYSLSGFYDGTGSTAGTLTYGIDVAVDQTTGGAYVLDPNRMSGSFSKFDSDGDPLPFSGLEGATSVRIGLEEIKRISVDNSPTPTQGDIYVLVGTTIKAYRPNGTERTDGGFPIGGFLAACSLAVDMEGNIWGVDYRRSRIVEFSSSGNPTGRSIAFPPIALGVENGTCDLAIDSNDNFYLQAAGPRDGYGKKFDSDGNYLYDFDAGAGFGAPMGVDVDLASDHVFTLEPTPFFGGEFDTEVREYDPDGEAITTFGPPDPGHSFAGLLGPPGLAVGDGAEQIYVSNSRDYGSIAHVEIFSPSGEAVVPTTRTEPPDLEPTEADLAGTVDPDGGGDATSCYFEWGESNSYGQTAPCTPAAPISGPGSHPVTAHLDGLTQGARYHYRLVTQNSNGILAIGRDRAFRPQGPLTISTPIVSEVNTDGARISAKIDPNGGDTTYRIEYGLGDCDLSACASIPVPSAALPKPLGLQSVSVVLSGLASGTPYHYRLVAANAVSEVLSVEGILSTYPVDSTADDCPNALVRKETGTVLLPDCRAYELVSAADAGGYDVHSDLVPGEVPFEAKPRAVDSVLYSVNSGKIPGVGGEPTNHGLDPYVATRTASGWSTAYVGIAVGAPPPQPPFGSAPLAESDDLSTLAFGGPDICSPCFDDGTTGIPVRRRGGPLAQGMAGDLDPGPAAADDGYVGRRLSADGTHLIFGSTSAFESDSASSGDVSIYERDLLSGQTRVVSKVPGGANLTCLQGAGSCHGPGNPDGIGSLDVAGDGSRVVVAQRVSTDAAGNRRWHPYMYLGATGTSVDLAPGTTSGVLYDGMTGDGSSVLYTTTDQLSDDDNDTSADVYRADVAANGSPTLTRVSTGSGAGDTDACNPVAAGARNNWNAVGASSPNGCGAVAFSGGSGVARGSGAIYFLSPEVLDGANGVPNQPNLYLAEPGQAPRFVAVLEASNPAITDAVENTERGGFGNIQVTPSGRFAAFSTSVALTDYPTIGHTAIYRYDAVADSLICASCATTGAALSDDTELSPTGLNLTDDGRVFFTTTEPLALRDTGSSTDVYERKGDRLYLISTGRSPTATGLLSVSADGRNAFFFIRDTLVSGDRNGNTIKIYTAREGGGFATAPALQDCKASDECHGPSSAPPAAVPLPTYQGTGGNHVDKHKKKAKKKKKKHKKKKHKKHAKKHRGSAR